MVSGCIIVTGDSVSTINFFYSGIFWRRGSAVTSVGYLLCFGYYVFQIVGITFFALLRFRKFFDFLLVSVFKVTNVRKKPFICRIMACQHSSGPLWLEFQFAALQKL